MDASNDGGESVDQFLARIASLSHKKDDEDAERTRKVEEEMMQARKERQARRAERARSISPVKTGPASPIVPSPRVGASPRERSIEPPVTLTPHSRTQTPSRTSPPSHNVIPARLGSSPSFNTTRALPPPPPPEAETPPSPSHPPATAAGLSRSGTLSWQQRPLSRGFGSVRSRPLSGSRSPVRNLPEVTRPASVEQEEPELSRKDIAASLSSRDPAWFRQTQDRGIGSAAYRKSGSQEPEVDHTMQKGARLPGLGSDNNTPTSAMSRSTRGQVPRWEEDVPQPLNTTTFRPTFGPPQPGTDLHSPSTSPAPSSQAEDTAPKASFAAGQSDSDSPLTRTSSILASGRPPSPTKGLGGFVQSAMMRRSDSVSKRWSVQANSGLKRGDSIAGNKPIFSPPPTTSTPLGHTRTLSREPRALRDGTSSPLSGSRPSSSHEPSPQNLSLHRPDQNRLQSAATLADNPERTAVKVAERPSTPPSEPSLSRSPSKTLDPRRWSPTKASWLESALSKPESPRPAPSRPETPAWKLDMQRSKSSKDLQESPTRPASTFDPVSTGGLLRSPPQGRDTKPPPLFGSTLPKQLQQHADTPQPEKNNRADTEPDRHGVFADSSRARDLTQAPKSEQPVAGEKLPASKVEEIVPEVDRNLLVGSIQEAKRDVETTEQKPPPPATKPKPQTRPKTDLRGKLKTRPASGAASEGTEPEFKAVFGKLKRAQTQNYVAPDVLKDNISKGKAALSVTGGPQPRKRVDEFKESILQRKEAMKQGGGSINKKTEAYPSEVIDQDLPEALARQKTLHKAKPSKDESAVQVPPVRPMPLGPKPTTVAKSISAQVHDGKATSAHTTNTKPLPTVSKPKDDEVLKQEVKFNSTQPPVTSLGNKAQQEQTSETIADRNFAAKKDVPEKLGGHLAARLNPALAGLIARGGSPRPQAEAAPRNLDDGSGVDIAAHAPSSSTSAGNLEHMTKGRARGPKRRAPKSEAREESKPLPPPVSSPTPTPLNADQVEEEAPRVQAQNKRTWGEQPKVKSPAAATDSPISRPLLRDDARQDHADRVTDTKGLGSNPQTRTPVSTRTAPAVASKSPELRKISDKTPGQVQKDEKQPTRPAAISKGFDIATDRTLQKETFRPTASSVNAPVDTSTEGQSVRPLPLTPSKSKMNSPPKSAEPKIARPITKPSIRPAGLGLDLKKDAKKPMAADVLTPPSDSDVALQQRRSSPNKGKFEMPASQVVQKFFGTMLRSADRAEFDSVAFLQTKTKDSSRVKTISKQVWEVSGDGKRSTLPPQQEHILYEECMYLCVHIFESVGASKMVEVYLWTGDSVPDAAVEDTQLFCRKVARENSAKLEVIRQGKETSKFFSALGGIAVIRRTKSSAFYMVCGRRHDGHVSFDEVEMSAANLCSGFPFLISAKFGKLYLWKGQGSGPDEVSAARLISMDLSLTGEIDEISEGEEPSSFWETFSDRSKFRTSEMWSLRSMDQQNGFPCRLYRVESERPKSSGGFWGLRASSPPKTSNKISLQEIAPFSQKDLDVGSVYLLDAYAILYVLPGSSNAPKTTEFVSALHIAQEIAVLAPSIEDRSLLPSCEVVFGEPPRDFTAAFRKWTPGLNVDTSQDAACLEVAEVLRALD